MIVSTFGLLQIIFALRVFFRLIRCAAKERVKTCNQPQPDRLTIILPVLNEAKRIWNCLDSLTAQTDEVREILIVDGGSSDGTQSIVEAYSARDSRMKLIDASPVNQRWTGKAWGLNVGLQHASLTSDWILCVDADVRPRPLLARSLLAHARRTGVSTFSVATLQKLSGLIDGLIHPSFLATLIYRFGMPGSRTRDLHRVQANGQCFIARRETLIRTAAILAAHTSLCEDITIVRRMADCGELVGFYETEELLVDVSMYADWRETWANWSRSLPMHDQYYGWRETIGLVEVLFVQALPLPIFLLSLIVALPIWIVSLNAILFTFRLGVSLGLARAYRPRPWSYWFAPVADLPAALKLIQSALKRRHSWRGRTYLRAGGGIFEPIENSK